MHFKVFDQIHKAYNLTTFGVFKMIIDDCLRGYKLSDNFIGYIYLGVLFRCTSTPLASMELPNP